MSAYNATLTPHQQRVLFPKSRSMEGSFTAFIDTLSVNIQTTSIVHDTTEQIFGITGRNAEGQDTVRELYIQFPDNTPAGTNFRLEESEFTKVRVWYSVKSPTANYSVRVIQGSLSIQQIAPQVIHIQGACGGATDTNPSGNTHSVVINFDLRT